MKKNRRLQTTYITNSMLITKSRKRKHIGLKRGLKTLSTFFLVMIVLATQVQVFSAFEAHIINVTAQIVEPCLDGYSITGYKFNDLNQDGVMAAEPGLSGWTIELEKLYDPRFDYNDDGFNDALDIAILQLVADDDNLNPCPDGKKCNLNVDFWVDNQDVALYPTYPLNLGNRLTDGNGYYEFSNLETGRYHINEVLQPDWVAITPVDVIRDLSCGENIVDFGNFLEQGPECGDGNWDEATEECDDGNLINGDGCDEFCQNELICEPDVELISNGSFEDPIVTEPSRWDIFVTAQVPGWDFDWATSEPEYQGYSRPTEVYLELHRGVLGPASDGLQYAELDTDWNDHVGSLNGEPASVAIYQTISTIVGEQYTVTYDFSPRPNTNVANNQLELSIDGVAVQTVGGAGGGSINWAQYSYSFIASGAITTITLTDLGTPDSLGTFVDNVSTKCDPIPKECVLELTKVDSPDPVAPGEQLIYTLRLENTGTANCTGSGVQVEEHYDLNTTFVSSNPTPTADNNLWNFGTIVPGDFREVAITMDVSSQVNAYDVLLNEACFWSAEYDTWTCITEETAISPVCSNYVVEPGEECDDGNLLNDDGCSELCVFESPVNCMKVNEVYYDPDTGHGSADDEWIELYNACDFTVNIQDWYLEDNNSTEAINQSYPIGAGEFVVIAANASTWSYWPDIPDNAFKIALGGVQLFDGLNNDGDRVFLYDNHSNQIDTVSWGTDTSAFTPSVTDVAQGHSIARITAGVDTDTAADWEDLITPNPGTNPHSLLETILDIIIPDPILGCTDDTALNYDLLATQDDGSCTYPVLGCTDPDATNYDDLATLDDASCIYPILGCMDSDADNYDPDATVDDFSCAYAEILGCMDPGANNYDPGANTDDGTCDFDILGCMDPAALNYDPTATLDDGSCTEDTDPDPQP